MNRSETESSKPTAPFETSLRSRGRGSAGWWIGLAVTGLALSPPSRAAEDVTVVRKAEPRQSSCPLTVYGSEAEITDKFSVLCELSITKETPFTGVDMTGTALARARARACECGANGLILRSNSSDQNERAEIVVTRPGYFGSYTSTLRKFRQSETVRATAIGLSGTPPPPSGGRPPNMLRPGFRDLGWGAPLDERFRRVEEAEAVTRMPTYQRPSDVRQIGEVTATSIHYLAPGNQIAGVRLLFDVSYWTPVKRMLDTDWGLPWKCSAGEPRCVWRTDPTRGPETVAALTERPGQLELLIANPTLYLNPDNGARGETTRPRLGVQDDPATLDLGTAQPRLPRVRMGRHQNMPSGFLDLRWGAPVFQDATPPRREDGKDCYERKSDGVVKRALGASVVTWCFVQGRLYDSTMVLTRPSAENLVSRLSKDWGEPTRDGQSYEWEAEGGTTIVRLAPVGEADGVWHLHAKDGHFFERSLGLD